MRVGGALIATAAVILRSFPILLLGTLFIGFGNSSNQLSRYTAADLVPPAKRASAIGLVVWGATVGSVVGPTLVPVASSIAPAFGLPALAGPYLVPVIFVAIAAILAFVLLRPDAYATADESAPRSGAPAVTGEAALALGRMLRRPGVTAGIVALVAAPLVITPHM